MQTASIMQAASIKQTASIKPVSRDRAHESGVAR
jgi:hypothetical protein